MTETSTATSAFTVEVDQNRFLPAGGTRVDAIVTVTSSGRGAPATGGPALEMLIIDCSSSMGGDRISSARRATAAAIAQLRDGVAFVVIAGTQTAKQVYPATGTATADADTRAAATAKVSRLRADGGTGIGAWLRTAGEIAQRHDGEIKHAILLTDGENGDRPAEFAAALDAVTGRFTCDCRGVGTDWKVAELRRVASVLLGSVGMVADPAELAADFAAMMTTAMGKTTANVTLRIRTPQGAVVRLLKQVAPAIEDLTARRTEAGQQEGDYPLGSWGTESREYHIGVDVAPGAVGKEMLVAKARLLRAGSADELGQAKVLATWTDDLALSTRINRNVAHYTGQAELADAVQSGLAALRDGDEQAATAQLGHAVALAATSGNDRTARLLEQVVQVIDAPSGTVQLRRHVADDAEMMLDTYSVQTARVGGA